ncbi:hypothetical protein [Methanobrevibacter sp.]|uniref:hypothetical protein n=1 Tax=Methanobrevibacter sp. TaxID=66852 RepID=UPI0038906A18
MKIKGYLIMLILACLLISIAGVSASDLNDTLTVSIDEPADDGLSVSEENLQLENKTKTFEDLVAEIENATPGDIISIDKDYHCENITRGIVIATDNITIYGAGSVFYGSENVSGFDFITVSASNVVLKDIIFTSFTCNETYNVIEWVGGNGTITSCSFYNCSSNDEGIVEWVGSNGLIEECEFADNIVGKDAGAVFARGDYFTLASSRFANNSANRGGAIFANGKNYKIKSCLFENNVADEGGAVYGSGIDGVVDDCNFNNNRAYSYGGAINWQSNYGNITNSIFENNRAVEGGAIRVSCLETHIINNRFTNNSAVLGGAIYTAPNKNVVINSSKFYENKATTIGGAVCCEGQGIISDSEFEANVADNIAGAVFAGEESSITDSIFKNNHADNIAGAVGFLKDGNIAGSTFEANSAENEGAVIFLENGKITNSSFEKNTAQLAGAILASANLTVNDTKFKDNIGELYSTNNIVSVSGEVILNNVESDTPASLRLAEVEFVGVANNTYGNNVLIMFDVKVDDNLFANPDGIVLLTINGQNYAANASNGTVVFTVPNLNAGMHYYSVMYVSPGFVAYETNGNFTVNPLKATLTAKTSSFVINYAKKYSVTLKDENGKPVSGEKITFVLNGKTIGSAKTNSNGIATIKIPAKALKTAKAGNKKLVISVISSNVNVAKKTVTVKINKEKTKIVAKKKTFKRSKKVKKYKIKLKNSKGKPVKKAKLTLKIKGKKFKAKTNAKGIAVFKIKKLTKKGNFKAKIIFKGNAYYKKVSKKVKIKIK